jgi:antitoxin ParD1/3/4/toxin ParE1/3/4
MKRYVLSASAEADLTALVDYYLFEKDSPQAAETILRELRLAFRRLVEWPRQGHRRSDLTSKPFLFWRVRSYLIVYRPQTMPVQIVAILHAKRNLPIMLQRRP